MTSVRNRFSDCSHSYRIEFGTLPKNANAASVSFTLWLETVQGQPAESQLQYTQTVLLNFNGLSWPHVSVATLRKQ